MDPTELKAALDSHADVLAALGVEVHRAVVEPPASEDELLGLESDLGMRLPPTFRAALGTLSRRVSWSWHAYDRHDFAAPFDHISSGALDWSVADVPDAHRGYLSWVEQCFPDPSNSYDLVWHNKLGFASAPNGDVLSVDLAPERYGAIVYLSHDDGEGHGYVMATSLVDLVDRWVPLACPGPEDWQWLPFVPYDLGPIDPTCAGAKQWREHVGLQAAPPETPPSQPDDQTFDELIRAYAAAPSDDQRVEGALRALKLCSTARASQVMDLLYSESGRVQGAAAMLLGRWQWEPATAVLAEIALHGDRTGLRITALNSLRAIPGSGAEDVLEVLRASLGPEWSGYLR